MPRLPLDPVDDRFGLGTRALAERVGVWPRTVQKWRRRGVDPWTADTIAVRRGTVPSELWGDAWEHAADAAAAAAEPETLFDALDSTIAGDLTPVAELEDWLRHATTVDAAEAGFVEGTAS